MMSSKRSAISLQSKKNWTSAPLYIRKYQHLWNLLDRSSMYASALLSLIQSKERRKKRKLAAKLRKKHRKPSYNKSKYSDELDVKYILEKVLCEVVEAAHFNLDRSNNLVKSEQLQENTSMQQLPSLKADENFSNFADRSNADSAIGESIFFSDNQSCKTDLNDTCSTKFEENFWSDNNDSFLSDIDYEDTGSDNNYVLSLKQRRNTNTSTQLQIKSSTLLSDTSYTQNPDNSLKDNGSDNINTPFSNTFLIFEESSNLLLPKVITTPDNKKQENYQKIFSYQKASKTSDFCVLELCNHDGNKNSFSKRSNFLKNTNIICNDEKFQAMKTIGTVSCPICEKPISAKTINSHLDLCTSIVSKKKSLRSSRPENYPSTSKNNDYTKSSLEHENKMNQNKLLLGKDSSPSVNGSDNVVTTQVMSTGVEKLKSALKSAIANSAAVKDLVVQSAAADEKLAHERPQTSDCDNFMNALAQSPVLTDVSALTQFKVKSKPNLSESDSDLDEEKIKEKCSFAPARRSTRLKTTKKSYCEINSSDNNEDDYDDYQYLEPICPRKKKKVNQKEVVRNKNDTDNNVATCSSEPKDLKVSDETLFEYDYESENVGLSEEEIAKLLAKKLYMPNRSDTAFLPEDKSGLRYYKQEPVNPAQPKYFTGGVLREYQVTGFQWLKLMIEIGVSGILADEMGLGKTVQCIALMCKLVKTGDKGPFLVCGPTSTIDNWMSEFKRFAPKIPLLLYHGSVDERMVLKQQLMEKIKNSVELVVITSYEILLRDKTALSSFCWTYWILDEGHRVKNLHSKTFRDLKDFPAMSKLLLSGTPLQNNVSELWSLLNFILPEVFDDIYAFESWFGIESLEKNEKLLAMLHQILTPFVLRRVKADVEVKIPPKREILVSAPLGSLQEKYYRATVDKSIVHLIKNKEYYDVTPGVASPELGCLSEKGSEEEKRMTRSKLKGGKQARDSRDAGDYAIHITMNNMMMQLRRCCNHPYLVHFPLECGTEQLLVDEGIVMTCGKMMLLDRMLPALKEAGHKVLMFSQMTSMLNILEDYCDFRHFSFVRFDGSTKCEERYKCIKSFNDDPDIFIFLLSTRAGGLGINLTAADTVIIYDSDWNPHNDIQAQDRCHRIGQKRPVVVYRLVTMGTIDQQMVERAAMKRKLEKMIMHQEKFKGHLASELKSVSLTSSKELLKVLESASDIHVVDNQESVISDSDLRKLLDRSDMIAGSGSINRPIPLQNPTPVQSLNPTPVQSLNPTPVQSSNPVSVRSSNAVTFQVIEETEETKVCA